MEILEEKNNNVLKRKEIKIIVEAGKNPTLDEAVEIVAKEFKAEKDNVVIKQVKGKFGRNTFLISSFIYDSKEDKEAIEPKLKKKAGEEGEKSVESTKETEKPSDKVGKDKELTENKPEERPEEKKEESDKGE